KIDLYDLFVNLITNNNLIDKKFIIKEMIELGAYLNYVDKVSHYDQLSNSSYKTLFLNSDLGSALVKKYFYLVFSLSILITGMYIALYQGSWTEQKGPFAWFEMLQLIMWFSAFMANLYDIFHGAVGLCQQYRSAYSLQQIPKAARFIRIEHDNVNEKVVVEIEKKDFDINLGLEINNDKEVNSDDCKQNESIC
ncbi:10714_t:CDS:2, partial [Dentiscutata heterogama]